MKVEKVDLTKWKVSLVFWLGRLNILKMYALSRLIYKINARSMNTLTRYFIVLDNLIKFIWKD